MLNESRLDSFEISFTLPVHCPGQKTVKIYGIKWLEMPTVSKSNFCCNTVPVCEDLLLFVQYFVAGFVSLQSGMCNKERNDSYSGGGRWEAE